MMIRRSATPWPMAGQASVGGTDHAEAHIAFHFGALYVLQLLEEVVTHKSAEAAAVALAMLTAELDELMKAHAITTQ